MPDVVVDVTETVVRVDVDATVQTVVVSTGTPGPPGEPGASGGFQFVQSTPCAMWSFTHSLGRRPNCVVYIDNRVARASIEATDTTVQVLFPYPVTGILVGA